MKKTVLKEYARLLACKGVNIQKGQDLVINASLDQPEFVKMVVEEAYKAGARSVRVNWSYAPLKKLDVRYQSMESLCTVPDWELARWEHTAQTLPATLTLHSDSPDALKGINMAKYAKANKATRSAIKPYRDRTGGKSQWCIAAVPSVDWAKKLFPQATKFQAVEKMWEAILATVRVKEGQDAVAAWKEHDAETIARCKKLTELHIRSLHYKADNGTDFSIDLIPGTHWDGGGAETEDGIFFNPNMPTEECFNTPNRRSAKGFVVATKPLSYQGQLIENFSIRFEEGKAVEVHAEKGEDLLRNMIATDEGACYLGEAALVPQSSPIATSGLLFYNTLFDENAACHLALGNGYGSVLPGFGKLSPQEREELGINSSIIHVDFMIGCDSLDIDAVCENGETVAIFRQGNWAF